MPKDSSEKSFLAAEALAKRESLALSRLTSWCEAGDLAARRIGDQWFVDLRDWGENGGNLRLETARVVRAPFILLAAVFLLIGIIGWPALATRFRAGNAFLTAAVSTFSNTMTDNQAAIRRASVYDLLWIELYRFWLGVNHFVQTTVSNLNYFWNQATDAWRKFINKDTSPPALESVNATTSPTALSTLDAAALAALKAQIKAELLRDLATGTGGNNQVSPASANAPGLVVLPSTGDPARDEALKLELKNSFSDQVEVRFDPSGQAGIITPIFQTGRGSNYLFILTPLKQSP